MTGKFVISLDFELLWGVRDHSDRAAYGRNILGARKAIPKMLDIFGENGIHATWATVGFLFCESKAELLESLPEQRPGYAKPALSNYSYLDEVGENEKSDPYYFAPSLIDLIRRTPGQEIGTHTMSHFYCLEDGATVDAFEADLKAAREIATRRGIELTSIVFPRNQFSGDHLDVCKRLGITSYRGNPSGWAYEAAKGAEQTRSRRALRLIDAYTGTLGAHDFTVEQAEALNIPASRFLRPCSGLLSRFHGAHIAEIKRGMSRAAKKGTGFHLWWHPHNFGRDLDANLEGLREVIAHYQLLREGHGMFSATMSEVA